MSGDGNGPTQKGYSCKVPVEAGGNSEWILSLEFEKGEIREETAAPILIHLICNLHEQNHAFPDHHGSFLPPPSRAGYIDLCPTTNATDGDAKQLWETPLKVDQVVDGAEVRTTVGRVVAWQSVDSGFEAIALMDCPWMVSGGHCA